MGLGAFTLSNPVRRACLCSWRELLATSKDQHKEQLLRDWREQEKRKLADLIPMSHEELRSLFDLLDRKNSPACDHTLRETTGFLIHRGHDVERVVGWLHDHGGYCDCEVIFNVASTFGDILGWTE